jgi:hypothetical protein
MESLSQIWYKQNFIEPDSNNDIHEVVETKLEKTSRNNNCS